MDSPVASAAICAMPTADESNHSHAGRPIPGITQMKIGPTFKSVDHQLLGELRFPWTEIEDFLTKPLAKSWIRPLTSLLLARESDLFKFLYATKLKVRDEHKSHEDNADS